MKIVSTSFALIIVMHALSQEIKLSSSVGIGLGSSRQEKTFFLAKELQAGFEKPVGTFGVVSVTIAVSTLTYTYTDWTGAPVFLKRGSLILPVTLKRVNAFSAKSSYFLELGCAPALTTGIRRERRHGGIIRVETDGRSISSLALISGIGYKRVVDGIWSISLGLNNYIDVIVEESVGPGHLRQRRTLLNIAFYRKLNIKDKPKKFETL